MNTGFRIIVSLGGGMMVSETGGKGPIIRYRLSQESAYVPTTNIIPNGEKLKDQEQDKEIHLYSILGA